MGASEVFSEKTAGFDAAARAGEPGKMRMLCICRDCPTYNECMREKDELLFCFGGKSLNCTFEKRGCLCPTCPVTSLTGLSKSYYCIRGSEQEQRAAVQSSKTAGF
jgi:hypothetical protein